MEIDYQHQAALLTSLVDSIQDVVLYKDVEGKYLGCNARFAELMGYSKEMIIGKTDYELLDRKSAELYNASDQEVLRSKKSINCVEWIIYPNGDKVLIDTHKTPFFGPDGSLIGIIGIGRDITELELTQTKLVHQTSMQDLLLNITNRCIKTPLSEVEHSINTSLGELTQFVNADRGYVFDYSEDKKTCTNTFEWVQKGISPHKANLQAVSMDEISEFLVPHSMGKAVYIPSVSSLPSDYTIRKLMERQEIKSLVTIPLMNNDYCNGFVGFDFVNSYYEYNEREEFLLKFFAQILVNIKSRIELEKELIVEKQNSQTANIVKSEFITNISHEIRTPLNAILGFSEALLSKLTDQEHKILVSSIYKGGTQLMGLLNDVLDLSKIESGRIEISLQPVEICNLIKETVSFFNEIINKKKLEIIYNFSTNNKYSYILDDLRIKQVLFNMIGNAVKYTDKGHVKISMEYFSNDIIKGNLTIQIEDTGIGIARSNFDSIFETFQKQAHGLPKTYEGLGLGLTISKKLIERMNGTIVVESTIGKGSVFTISIPNIRRNRILSSSGLQETFKVQFNGDTILVVDDIYLNTEMIKKILTPMGLNVIAADCGEAAIQILKELTPTLILLDMRMPGLNGFEVAKIIKEDLIKEIPIIAYTASVFNVEQIMNTGHFDGHVLKPIRRGELISIMCNFMPYQTDETIPELKVSNEKKHVIIGKIKNSNSLKSLDKNTQDELISDWYDIKDSLVFFKIELFAQKIILIGQTHQFQMFVDYGERLLDSINQFDIDNIKERLQNFPELIHNDKSEF